MPTYDRSHSTLQMTSPLGVDVLIPSGISGTEAISQPYSYKVQIVSEQRNISPDKLLHQPGCVVLRNGDDPARYFNGIFQEFTASGQPRADMYAYNAVLVPKLYFLGQTSDCRVFQNKTTVQILQQMFQDAEIDRTDFRIYGDRPVRPYTVQFNETDLKFATRLMQQSGYFYFFEHSADQHTLVVADSNDAFKDIPAATLRFNANVQGDDVLNTWHCPRATTTGKATLKDYDATQPSKVLQASQQGDQQVSGADSRDVFSWPAKTVTPDVVSARAKIMIEAAEAQQALVNGAGSFRAMGVGGCFTLDQDPVTDAQNVSHAVRSMSFQASDETWQTDSTAQPSYSNSFESLPAGTNWREAMSEEHPKMSGIYTGIVIGGAGDEIATDELARVKVRFPWDWRSEAGFDGGFWARVMQPWAGDGWGTQFIPRVGTEVAVGFENGDPDHPIVLGGLYNGEQSPIFPLPDEKNVSGVKTRSTKGGGSNDFNQLSFDDTNGSEMVKLLSQKDMDVEAKHDQTVSIGNNRTVHVSNAEKITVDHGRTTTISDSDDSLTVEQGNLSISVSMGQVTVNAMQSITLTVGLNSIRIDQTGVTISGLVVNVTGTTSVSVDAPMTSVSGDATLTITGGLVAIN